MCLLWNFQKIKCMKLNFKLLKLFWLNESTAHAWFILFKGLNFVQVLLASVANLSEDDQDTLKDTLQHKLENFSLPVEIIATAMNIYAVITKKRNNDSVKVRFSSKMSEMRLLMSM